MFEGFTHKVRAAANTVAREAEYTGAEFMAWVRPTPERTRKAELIRLYRTALFRSPDQVGMSHYLAELESGRPIGEIRKDMILSDEFNAKIERLETQRSNTRKNREGLVRLLYSRVLERKVDPSGLETYAGNPGSMLSVRDELVHSEEFRNRYLPHTQS